MARASEDWRRLLGLCGVARVAVVDEQRIYDPNDQDDKLLLELKGTMSEAEIHWLRLRLQGADRRGARRDEPVAGQPHACPDDAPHRVGALRRGHPLPSPPLRRPEILVAASR